MAMPTTLHTLPSNSCFLSDGIFINRGSDSQISTPVIINGIFILLIRLINIPASVFKQVEHKFKPFGPFIIRIRHIIVATTCTKEI